ncbi:hypothetical protein ACS0TY_032726 [Phlomoides rotata]
MSSACRHSPKIQNTHRNKKGFRISFGIGSVIAQDAGAPASATSIRDFINHDSSLSSDVLFYIEGAILDKTLQPYESHIPFLLQFLGCNKMKRCNKFKEKIKRVRWDGEKMKLYTCGRCHHCHEMDCRCKDPVEQDHSCAT